MGTRNLSIKVRYIERSGCVFKRVDTHMGPCTVVASIKGHSDAYLPTRLVRSYHINVRGRWRYCFANVEHKHVKKWMDYFIKKYEEKSSD
jgi:hypothetical protein